MLLPCALGNLAEKYRNGNSPTLQLFTDAQLSDVIVVALQIRDFLLDSQGCTFLSLLAPSESQLIRVDLGKASSAQRSGAIACRSESLGFQNTSPETRLKSLSRRCLSNCEHVFKSPLPLFAPVLRACGDHFLEKADSTVELSNSSIRGDIGSIGDFAASAEVAFGTILQRTYASCQI